MATANPSLYAATNSDPQDCFEITYPLADIKNFAIANVSKATTAVVSTTAPVEFIDGAKVLITGVGGMTQLATNGVDGTNTYYANVITANTFGLYSDAELTANVNSSSFSNAVASTGQYNLFTVPQYNSKQFQLVAFPTESANIGTDIVASTITDPVYGYFTYFQLNGGLTYKIEARAFPTPNSKQSLRMTVTSGQTPIGEPIPLGSTFTAYVSPVTDIYVQAVVATENSSEVFLEYPTQIVDASISIQVVDGFTVA